MNPFEKIKAKFTAAMADALKNDNPQAMTDAISVFAAELQELILTETRDLVSADGDSAVLAARGARALTTAETAYYEQVIAAMRAPDIKAAISNIDVVMPETVIDAVFEELTESHPLLSQIRFTNTGALVRWLLSDSEGEATWGELTGDIGALLGGEFAEKELHLVKLSARFLVANAMLDLGPVWLDRWVRTILFEAIAVQLEAGAVDGDGKNKPIGMTRALTGAVDGVYPRKTPVPVTSLDPETYGTLLATLTQTRTGKRRPVSNVLLVVNPVDYFTKVFPATTIRSADGTFANNVFPFPTTVVQSAAVPEGYAVFGLARRYFFGIGMSSSGGRLEYDDSIRFFEDERAYRIKLYGNGQPLDENAFIYADIRELRPVPLAVYVENYPPLEP